jgi:hypothetical protein
MSNHNYVIIRNEKKPLIKQKTYHHIGIINVQAPICVFIIITIFILVILCLVVMFMEKNFFLK